MSKTYSIVGTNHTGKDVFLKNLEPGTDAVLIREPENPFDPLAVAVWIAGEKVGYVPKKQNAALAQFIDQSGTRVADLAMDAAGVRWPPSNPDVKFIPAKFLRSPNSGFPQVEV